MGDSGGSTLKDKSITRGVGKAPLVFLAYQASVFYCLLWRVESMVDSNRQRMR